MSANNAGVEKHEFNGVDFYINPMSMTFMSEYDVAAKNLTKGLGETASQLKEGKSITAIQAMQRYIDLCVEFIDAVLHHKDKDGTIEHPAAFILGDTTDEADVVIELAFQINDAIGEATTKRAAKSAALIEKYGKRKN